MELTLTAVPTAKKKERKKVLIYPIETLFDILDGVQYDRTGLVNLTNEHFQTIWGMNRRLNPPKNHYIFQASPMFIAYTKFH